MIGVTLKFNLSFFLLCVATALFVLSATRLAKGWMTAIGLACFSGAFIAQRLDV